MALSTGYIRCHHQILENETGVLPIQVSLKQLQNNGVNMEDRATINRISQREWYYRHKNKNGRIYKITNVITGDVFVGATTNSLKKRWWQHVATAGTDRSKLKLYASIREYGKEAFEVELLKELDENDNKMELEQQFIEELSPNLNKKVKY